MAEVDLSSAADTLRRAADRLEKLTADTTHRRRWYRDHESVWPGEGDGIDVNHLDNAKFVAALDPHAVAALPDAMRALLAICAGEEVQDQTPHWTARERIVAGWLTEFARRLLREETS